VYVADTNNHTVRKINVAGFHALVTTLAGTPGLPGSADSHGPGPRLRWTASAATDRAGNTYVADPNNHIILKITADGGTSTFAGVAGVIGSADGNGTAASFHAPSSVAVDGAGNVYVGDTLNYTVRKITPDGTVSTIAGTAGIAGQLQNNLSIREVRFG
jgi:hypothetical protein